MEEQLKGLEDKTDSKRTITDNKDEEQSYDSRDEKEDEVEPMEEEEPDRSQNDNEIASTEQEQPNAPQNDYESDGSDIVDVQPPSNSPAKIPIEEDNVVPDRDDDPKEDASSDIGEVQPQPKPNPVKRPLEEEEEASHNVDDSNEGGQERLAPAAKRARIDEDSDGEGSAKSVTSNQGGSSVDNLNEVAASDIVEGEKDEAPIVKIASIDEDIDDDGSGLYEC